ncbi:LytR/AlgR family response regulator transcription factor [Sediminibacterium salmoneum]|uniref:LytR/AlgR family response regulator transcription factor n=1 Tax=Sediminibacterium salmoneum TaxID=426421 RepID=UPI000478B2B2|nr:LytTR family DNA-binding domain-containing protein [Sediminibacterium salmoneum]
MIKVIIVDDEQHCIDRLKSLFLTKFAYKLKLVGTASSVLSAYDLIVQEKPDLIFLDVQLNELTGFDLLSKFDKLSFDVIFTTAYEKYAVKAFKFSAIGYLLKPVDIDDLKLAIDKFSDTIEQKDYKQKFDLLYANFKQLSLHDKKIAVPTLSGIEFIPVSSIIRCESDINYTTLYLTEKTKLVVAKTLKEFEELLTEYNFFRVHNSHLINLSFIKFYNKGKGGTVQLTDGSEVEVSTRRKEAFISKVMKSD